MKLSTRLVLGICFSAGRSIDTPKNLRLFHDKGRSVWTDRDKYKSLKAGLKYQSHKLNPSSFTAKGSLSYLAYPEGKIRSAESLSLKDY